MPTEERTAQAISIIANVIARHDMDRPDDTPEETAQLILDHLAECGLMLHDAGAGLQASKNRWGE